jgi:hypothetical protein
VTAVFTGDIQKEKNAGEGKERKGKKTATKQSELLSRS